MAETYTEEDLRNETRAGLRRIGMEKLGLAAREISEMKSDAIIAAILEKSGSPAPKKKAAPAPEPEPKNGKGRRRAAPEPEPEPEPEPDSKGTSKQLDAIGKVLDELTEEVNSKFKDVESQQYILVGLISDIWKTQVGDPDELQERLDELVKECSGGNE